MILQTGKVLAISTMYQRGFTLTEVLVVIGIILVIAASVLAIIPGLGEKTQTKATKALIDRLDMAIEQYYSDNRSYPATGITNLKTTLQPSESTAKQYIELDDAEAVGDNIIDAWGNALVYTYPGTQNTSSYDLYSTGSDGITNTSGNDADDINNWSR